LVGTPAYERSRQSRKRIEMLFAHLKRILKMGRLRLRGPCGAQDEFLLAATAQNLRKLAKLITSSEPQMPKQAEEGPGNGSVCPSLPQTELRRRVRQFERRLCQRNRHVPDRGANFRFGQEHRTFLPVNGFHYLTQCMDRPCVARGFGVGEVGLALMYPALRGAALLAIMDIRAHWFSLAGRPFMALWVTRAPM
jgi:hypothetical protein